MDKPDVDFIEGLSPAISIDQKSASRNPRSTVGTITEVYDYLRLLFARIGVPHCPHDGTVITRQTPAADRRPHPRAARGHPLPGARAGGAGPQGQLRDAAVDLATQGYARARIDGEVHDLTEKVDLARYEQHTIEVVVDRLVQREGIERRLTDSLETALRLAEGVAEVAARRRARARRSSRARRSPSASTWPARTCGAVVRGARAPQLLVQLAVRRLRALRRAGHPLRGRPRAGRAQPGALDRGGRHRRRGPAGTAQYFHRLLEAVCDANRDPDRQALGEAHEEAAATLLLYGGHGRVTCSTRTATAGSAPTTRSYEGVVPYMQRRHSEAETDSQREQFEGYMREVPCPECGGARLKPLSLGVTIDGHNIADLCAHVDPRGGRGPRGARAVRARPAHRRAGGEGGQRPPGVPARRRARLPHLGPLGRHPGRR